MDVVTEKVQFQADGIVSQKSCIVACLPREDGDFDVVAELKPNRGRLVPSIREGLDDRLLEQGLALHQFVYFQGDFFGVDVVTETTDGIG